jgi:diguanylate cyclase (GGDEF)-like protein/PAS domain S-box-containing protein
MQFFVHQSSVKDVLVSLGDLFDVLPDAIIVVDGAGRIALANAAVQRILGYAAEELVGQPLERLIPERYRAQHERQVRRFRQQGTATVMGSRPVLHALGKSGMELPISISIANLDLEGERFSVAVIRDAASVRDHLGQAIARAESDALTGIGNRLCLLRRMQGAIAASRPFALLFLDLTKFKPFNDRYGHKVGDEVLRLVARRIQVQVRARDLAVRLGGDEFVILLDALSDPRLVEARAAAIADSLCRPFHVDSVSGTIGVNIGGAIFPRDGRTAEELLGAADRNMYRAKHSGQSYQIDYDSTGRNNS